MPDGVLKRVDAGFRPALFVNHYGSSEIYTFTTEPRAVAKPGSAGMAGLNQRIRVVKFGSSDPDARAVTGEEGQIIADGERRGVRCPAAARFIGSFFLYQREGLSASFRSQDRATDDFTLKGALSGLPPSSEIEHLVGVHPISGLDDVARFGVVHASAVPHPEPHGPAFSLHRVPGG
jgi:hypothetical protein